MMLRGRNGIVAGLVATLLLAGAAGAQRGGFGRRGGRTTLLAMSEVQAELKLTDAQKSKVTSMLAQPSTGSPGQAGSLRGLTPAERQQRQQEARAHEDQQANAILTADQQQRYHQLRLQQQGLAAVADKPVADALKLTDAQRSKIEALVEAQQATRRGGRQAGANAADRQARREQLRAARQQMDDSIAAVLTDEQKQQWQAMLGAPFTFPTGRGALNRAGR